MKNRVPGVLLTGTIGAGKTVLATAMGEVLADADEPNAVIDLDWLGWFHSVEAPPGTIDRLIATNLAAVWPNLRDAGALRVLMTRAVTELAQVESIVAAVPDVDLTVVRVTASPATITARLMERDRGAALEEHLEQAAAFASRLDAASLEDLVIATDDRAVEDLARDLLGRIGWPSG